MKCQQFKKRSQPLLTATMTALLLVVLGLAGYYSFHHKQRSYRALHGHSQDDLHVDLYGDFHFQETVRQVCSFPRLPPLEYRGVRSLAQYLLSPDHSQCPSWVKLGQLVPETRQKRQNKGDDEEMNEKYVCMTEAVRAAANRSCQVYYFTAGGRTTQLRPALDHLTCVVHSFSYDKEPIQEACVEEAWGIPEHPRREGGTRASRHHALGGSTSPLHHSQGRGFNFLTTGDLQGHEWSLLRKMVTNHDLLDIGQLSVRLRLPLAAGGRTGRDEHDHFKQLFQVLYPPEEITQALYHQ